MFKQKQKVSILIPSKYFFNTRTEYEKMVLVYYICKEYHTNQGIMRISFTLLLLFSFQLVFSQTIKELEDRLKSNPSTSEKIDLNFRLGEAYLKSNEREKGKKALPHADNAYKLARDNKNEGMAARSAYLKGQIYEILRNERNQEVWFRTAESHAKKAGDSDLIIKSVIKRGKLAGKERNYRRASQIYEDAFNYFSQSGTSISELQSRYEREKALLESQKKELEFQSKMLQDQITGLSNETDRLTQDKTQLEASQAELEKEKAEIEEEITTKEEELKTVSEAKQEAEALAEQRATEVKKLSRDTLEQRLLREAAENEANKERLRANEIRDLTIIGLVVASFLILFLLTRFLSKRRAARVLEDKNKIIEQERKRSDDLLLNILPASIADELKSGGKAKARRFEEVSVLFSDFKNFTGLAASMSPEELVELLDTSFKGFDQIISKYEDIEKIKTIGDAYLCAAGLSERKGMPYNLVRAALEMQTFLEKQKLERQKLGKPFFEARIGIHTGPVVAGVVGVKKFAYDIWGDTVNTASRVESNSDVGKVSISESTFNLIRYKFNCEYQGKVQAKNKGLIDLYHVHHEL